MEKKNLKRTEGLPFTLGVAGGVALLLSHIFSYNLNPVITAATYSAIGMQAPADTSGVGGLIETIGGFLIMPGIFLILLALGRNREKRGSAFAVVWIVITALMLAINLASQFLMKAIIAQVVAAVDAVMPGGYWIIYGFDVLGSALIVASCIAFLRRLHEPPVYDGPGAEPGNGDPPSSQP